MNDKANERYLYDEDRREFINDLAQCDYIELDEWERNFVDKIRENDIYNFSRKQRMAIERLHHKYQKELYG